MAETQLERLMDDFVRNVVNRVVTLEERDPENGEWSEANLGGGGPAAGADLRAAITLSNVGTETYVRNIEVRAVRNVSAPSSLTMYSSEDYADEVARVHFQFPNVLSSGESTDTVYVYLRGVESYNSYMSLGVYAEIVPQGHYWSDVVADWDL